jgi:hypothetical protein
LVPATNATQRTHLEFTSDLIVDVVVASVGSASEMLTQDVRL